MTSRKIVHGTLMLFLIGVIFFLYKSLIVIEGLTNNNSVKRTIVLMGDSILKNNTYVGKGKSVEDLLMEQHEGKMLNLAEDDSTIKDFNEQIKKLPNDLNDKNTTIFVSIGGNDILNKYVYVTGADIDDFTSLYKIYANYKNSLRMLREKFPQPKIMLINLYYPLSVKYLRYRGLIKKWNDLLFEYQNDSIHEINDILDLSLLMTDINDFALCIEPSETGSIKIVREILIF